jgi:esterase
MRYLENFHHQITGPESGPKLIFLHGVMGFGANWRTIAKAFENEYQVLAYDQRGHGRSMKPERGYSPEDYSSDLKRIIDELGWDKINLVGHSMGGRNSLVFAALYPTRVNKLVIGDIGPSMNEAGSAFILKLLNTIPGPFPTKRDAKAYFDNDFPRIFHYVRQRIGLAAYLYANIIEDSEKRGVWRFSEAGIRESIDEGRAKERWAEIRGLSMPTLLVRGEWSDDLPRETYDRILQENPRIQGVEIKAAGHWVHSDQPAAFIEALRGFFAQN